MTLNLHEGEEEIQIKKGALIVTVIYLFFLLEIHERASKETGECNMDSNTIPYYYFYC